jgi:phage terminase large subunit-like protein
METPNPNSLESADRYIEDVLSGQVLVGKYVRKAVERHVRDLSEAKGRGYYFDRAEAAWILNCFNLFRHTSGELAGEVFVLSPWQAFIVASVFGWKRIDDGTRRFRRVYTEVARRNGKSTLLAAIAIILLLLDGEPSAQVYSAATKRDQAKIVWREASKMVKASSELRQAIRVYRDSLAVPSTESTFIPLASDSKGLDGLNISGAVVDELHAHPTPDVWELIDTATGSRAQPLIWSITTAGFNQNGICYELRQFCIDVLNGIVENDQWFIAVYAIDQEDVYSDEACWVKANPNIPYIPSLLADLREKASRASRSANAMNNFLVKCLCRWTSQGKRWLKLEDWDKCKAPLIYNDLLHRPAFAAIDMAEKLDLTSACLCIPPLNDAEKWRYLWQFYLPQDTLDKHRENGDLRWEEWAKSGLLTVTEGATTDQRVVEAQILKWRDEFDLRQVAFDPHGMARLSSDLLDAGIEMVEITQRFETLNEATKEFEAQIVAGKLEHDGNVLMRWQVDNVCLLTSNDGFCRPIRPQRQSNDRKVDGVLAAVMALGQAIRNPIEQSAGFMFFA